MDDLLEIYTKSESYDQRLEEMKQDFIQKVRCFLWGASAPLLKASASNASTAAMAILDASVPSPSPRQNKKRLKRLSSLHEDDEKPNRSPTGNDDATQRPSTRASNSKLLEAASAMHVEEEDQADEVETKDLELGPKSVETESDPPKQIVEVAAEKQFLMPPPPAVAEKHFLMPPPAAVPATASVSTSLSTTVADSSGGVGAADHSFARPQRAAKLKSEKCLKEPKLNKKLRRPSGTAADQSAIKMEHEQRASQMHEISTASVTSLASKTSIVSSRSEYSVIVVPGKAPSVVELLSDDEQQLPEDTNKKEVEKKESYCIIEKDANNETRSLRIKIKREKSSLNSVDQRHSREAVAPRETNNHQTTLASDQTTLASDQTTLASNTTAATGGKAGTKKGGGRKKKAVVKPIKVERFSDIVTASPISSRTRGSVGQEGAAPQPPPVAAAATTRAASIYEDAVDNLEAADTATPPTRVSQVPKAVVAAAAAAEVNETVSQQSQDATVVLGTAPVDATFCTAANMTINAAAQTTFQVAPGGGQTTFMVDNQNPNATVTLPQPSGGSECDATFNVPPPVAAATTGKQQKVTTSKSLLRSLSSTRNNSMETAKDTSSPHEDSLITEDESFERPLRSASTLKATNLPVPKAPTATAKVAALGKLTGSAKTYKMPMPTRTNELFNPLIQSPVKKKVQAFENAAYAATEEQHTKPGRPKRTKENAAPTPTQPSLTTPVIGKLIHAAPSLGRFLTPTQATNITPNVALAHAKKGPNSASKAMVFPKSNSSSNLAVGAHSHTTNLKATNSMSREHSGAIVSDDFRKLAEERKKLREQKHLLAAQQREAKERERAERIAKLAKEREEKRNKKQQEADLKKREMEEINRKLRQQDEADAARQKAAAAASKAKAMQEQELHAQMKAAAKGGAIAKSTRMLPPAPKLLQSKYTFEMLHEDDSTDDEDKTSYKRPPAPTWSRSNVRGPAIRMQQYVPTSIIDSFFSVQPMTPDLKLIFPNIDPRHLKRNSSVLWSTPPRYSELPKY